MGTFFTDTSYYQVGLNNSYPHPFVSFRIADGTFIDPMFASNYSTAKKLANLKGIIGYYVFRPNLTPDEQYRVIQQTVGAPESRFVVMIDIESWGGQIGGNHSAEVNSLVSKLGAWLGSSKRVIVYGNQSDLASIYPNRPASVKLVVASYGSQMPNIYNMIAWQYSDGQTRWPVPSGFPRASSPFGSCDHNYSPLDPDALAVALGLGQPVQLSIEDEVMGYYTSKAAYESAVEAKAEQAVRKVLEPLYEQLRTDHTIMLHGDKGHNSIDGLRAQVSEMREAVHSIGLRVDAITAALEKLAKPAVAPTPVVKPATTTTQVTPKAGS